MTLDIERFLTVDAESREQALDRAVRWRSNEDDDRVAMIYDDVTGSRIERTEDDE